MFITTTIAKAAGLAILGGGLALFGVSQAAPGQEPPQQGHGDHAQGGHASPQGHAAHEHPGEAVQGGDPYLLDTDIVTGRKLGSREEQVVIRHQGRELRFGSEESASKFKADPERHLRLVDAAMAEQQRPFYPLEVCVVSGEKLGGMGDPVEMIHGNRLVRLCCNGCKSKFAKDPASFLAKLDAAVIEKQGKTYPLQNCVVTGRKLGMMGDPIDYVIGNRLVRLCCKGCVSKVAKDPRPYLDKLASPREGGMSGHEDGAHGEHGGHGGHGDGAPVMEGETSRCPAGGVLPAPNEEAGGCCG